MKARSRSEGEAAPPAYGTAIFICCMVAFVCYFGSYMRLPVVPLYARSLGADTTQVGIINSAFMLMAGLLSLPLGMMSDRLGRKLLASVGLLVLSATSFMLYFSKSPLQLVWIYLLFGIGLAAFGPTMMSIVADFSPTTHLGRSYGWYTTALYTAMSIGPAVGGLVAEKLGFLPLFLIAGMVVFFTFWLVIFLLPSPELSRSGMAKDRKVWATAKDLLKNRPLLGCWLSTLGGCFGLGMFITFFPLHAQNLHIPVGQIGIVFSAQGLSNAILRIPFGHLSDRVAPRRSLLVVIGSLGFVASLAGFALSKNTLHFMLSAMGLGVSMGLAFTSVGALIAEAVPPESRGLAMGGYNTCIYLGMMLSSAIMGSIIPTIGFSNGFLIAALVNFILIFFFHILLRSFSSSTPSSLSIP